MSSNGRLHASARLVFTLYFHTKLPNPPPFFINKETKSRKNLLEVADAYDDDNGVWTVSERAGSS